MKSNFYTRSQYIHAGEVKAIEVCPSNGVLEISFHEGMDQTSKEYFRMRASERSEFRHFTETYSLPGPTFLYFRFGEGAVTIFE